MSDSKTYCSENIAVYECYQELEDSMCENVLYYRKGCTERTWALHSFVKNKQKTVEGIQSNEDSKVHVSLLSSSPFNKSVYKQTKSKLPSAPVITVPDAVVPHYLRFYENFISENAEIEINLPPNLRKATETAYSGELKSNVFDLVVDEILNMLYFSTFKSYVTCKKFLGRAGVPRVNVNFEKILPPTPQSNSPVSPEPIAPPKFALKNNFSALSLVDPSNVLLGKQNQSRGRNILDAIANFASAKFVKSSSKSRQDRSVSRARSNPNESVIFSQDSVHFSSISSKNQFQPRKSSLPNVNESINSEFAFPSMPRPSRPRTPTNEHSYSARKNSGDPSKLRLKKSDVVLVDLHGKEVLAPRRKGSLTSAGPSLFGTSVETLPYPTQPPIPTIPDNIVNKQQ
ncbi:hypothetical protein HK098_001402 [Nowakowskiella sp. JEL0407]|nr:hypothetical protein HK098_001402 [Nowakowskiella sp. JEL0407]